MYGRCVCVCVSVRVFVFAHARVRPPIRPYVTVPIAPSMFSYLRHIQKSPRTKTHFQLSLLPLAVYNTFDHIQGVPSVHISDQAQHAGAGSGRLDGGLRGVPAGGRGAAQRRGTTAAQPVAQAVGPAQPPGCQRDGPRGLRRRLFLQVRIFR